MKVAINTRLLLPNRVDGITRFSYEIIKRWVRNYPNVEFHFLFDRKWDEAMILGENVVPHIVPPQSRHPLLWYAGFHWVMPFVLKKIQADVFFSPEFFIPPSSKIPKVSVFHDLDYEIRPQDVPYKTALWYYQHFFPKYAQGSDKIVAVSEHVKQNLVSRYQVNSTKIEVAYNGCDAAGFFPLKEVEQQQIRNRFTEGKPFFHFTGTIQPRKNVENLLRGFDAFKESYSSDIQLLLVGKQGWNTDSAIQAYQQMKHKEAVRFTGFVSDKDLAAIHASSLGLCIVSFLEGFGIPAVEAMYCDTPIISSNTAALPEVCGNAAVFVAPDNVQQIQNALYQLATDSFLREKLIQNGKIQRQRFSWDTSANIIWKMLEAVKAT